MGKEIFSIRFFIARGFVVTNISDIRDIVVNRTSIRIQTTTGPLGAKFDILDENLDFEIDKAIRDYSMDEPRIRLLDNTEADLVIFNQIDHFQFTDWDFDTSDPNSVEIEFPVDLARRAILRRGYDLDYEIVERPVASVRTNFIKFFISPRGSIPSTWRVRYKTRHQSISEDANLDALSDRNKFMVALLASVYAARTLAGKFGKTTEPPFDADVVDYRTRSAEWREIAKTLFDEYQNSIDRPSRIKSLASDFEVVDLDLSLQRGNRFGRDFLVHRKRKR